MNYRELEKVSEQRWITEGPNREGVSGYLLVGELLYYFYEEPGMKEPKVVSSENAHEFINEYDGKVGTKIQEIIDYLKKKWDDRR